MRSTFRLSMAAVLLIAAAGIARAQDASAAPPPAAPDVVKPIGELQPIPFAGSAPAVEPALTIDQSAIAVEPVVPAVEVAEPPAAEKPAKSEVTTTTKRVTKKTVRKPAEKPAVEVSMPAKPAAAAAAVSAVDMTANPPPPSAPANPAPAKSIQPLPPAANPAAVDPIEATKSQARMGTGSWFLAGIVVVALFGMITLLRRRKARRQTSIPDFTGAQALKPVLAHLPDSNS